MRKLLWLTAVLSFSPVVAVAEPQIKTPTCEAISFWATQVNMTDNFNVAPKLMLPKAFQDIYIVPLFGASVLTWTQEDLQAAGQALATCFQEAGKRHDQAASAALGNANRAMTGMVPHAAELARKAKTDADTILSQLDAMPPSAELARGIDALLKANPAAPDMSIVRGLPREIVEPIWRLAGVQLTLGFADRDKLWSALEERRRGMETTVAETAAKRVAAAPLDAGGVITLMEIQQGASAMSDSETKTKLLGDAGDKAQLIRDSLRQAKPPVWMPPACLDLYRWSGAPNAGGVTPVGRRSIVTGFLDERAVPVFGIPVSDWSNQDTARFKALRAICHTASMPPQGTLAGLSPETVELVLAANRGRWIDGADQQIADARGTVGDYHKARQDLAALRVKMMALPDTAASIAALATFVNDPVLAAVSQDDRLAFTKTVNEKRAAIEAWMADAAVQGLDAIKVTSTADLGKLFAYVAQTLPTLPDQRGQQTFAAAVNHDLDEITKRLLPEFNARLNATPASIDGLGQVKAEEATLGDGGRLAAFRPFHEAARARHDAIVQSVHDRACASLLSGLGVGRDASQDVWDGDKGMKLGDFICGLAEHGVAVSGYSGAGLFSSTSTLKLTPIHEGIEIVSLRKADVKVGQSMLAGYKIVDANGQPVSIPGAAGDPKGEAAVSIVGWEMYARQARNESPNVVDGCQPIMASPPGKLGPGETLFWLHCGTLPAVVRAIAAVPK